MLFVLASFIIDESILAGPLPNEFYELPSITETSF